MTNRAFLHLRRLGRRRILSFLPILLFLAGMLAGNGCANGLFYYPTAQVYSMPDSQGLRYEDVAFSSRDGTRLHGWFLPATTQPARGTIIHFHGNAQNLTAHYRFSSWLAKEGFNVFVFDYRGYGASAGAPDRQGVFEDGVAAIDYVRGRPDVDSRKLIIFGQSLGGAVALAVAGETHPAGVRAVVIESAFASYPRMAGDVGRRFPPWGFFGLGRPIAWCLVSGGHNPEDAVGAISPVPLLLVHGDADRVVPYHHGKELAAKANSPVEFWTIPGGDHTELVRHPDFRRRLVEFLDRSLATP